MRLSKDGANNTDRFHSRQLLYQLFYNLIKISSTLAPNRFYFHQILLFIAKIRPDHPIHQLSVCRQTLFLPRQTLSKLTNTTGMIRYIPTGNHNCETPEYLASTTALAPAGEFCFLLANINAKIATFHISHSELREPRT